MSIRITSNGHNFSLPSSNIPTFEKITLLIESSKAMLLPTILLDENTLEGHLLSGGIALSPLVERAVSLRGDDQTTAIIVLPISLAEKIDRELGDRAEITTPLLAPAPTHGHDLRVHLSQDMTLLCLNLYNGGDRVFAELFDIKGCADVLYWISRIGEGYDLSTYNIFINSNNRELEKLLKRYYKKVTICE
ncbi:MAG: hypothetical protein SNG10_04740 [Rikenellaceae bacterium]